MTTKSSTSRRAERVWRRLSQWYGARLAEEYGPTCPRDWAEVIDRADDEQIDRALAQIRREHVNHPPTFPQFEAAMRKPFKSGRQQSPAERLTEWIVAHKSLTPTQLRGPWKWLANSEGIVTGVVIAPDGESPGYRVMLEDMVLTDAA